MADDDHGINWEMIMSADLDAFFDFSFPEGVAVQVLENTTCPINHDHDGDDDEVVAMVVDLGRPSEGMMNGGGTSSGQSLLGSRRSSRYTRAPRVPIVAPPSPPPRVINQLVMRFLFRKQLHNSDVGAAGRIVIPKKAAELHLPALETKEGTWLYVDDMDLFRVWPLKFRFWPNNSSRMYVFENTKDFVAAHRLEVDDYIVVYKDDETGSFVIRGKKTAKPMMELFKLPAENGVNDTDNYQQNMRKSVMNNYPAVSIENGSNLPDLSYINGDGNNTTSISTNISNLHNGNPILMDDDQNSVQGTTGSAAQPYSSGFGGLAVLDQQYFPTASLASSEFSDFSQFFW